MANSVASVNFVKGRGVSFVDKFIQFSLTTGRFIVILTEFIALCAFIYRFSLDRQIIDLHDQIKYKQNIIALSSESEEKFRNLQERLNTIEDLTNQKSVPIGKIFSDILSFAPSNILINSITVSDTSIRIDATARSIGTITTLINDLKNYPAVASVSLDKIENRTSNGTIIVNISAKLKQSIKKV